MCHTEEEKRIPGQEAHAERQCSERVWHVCRAVWAILLVGVGVLGLELGG